MSEKTFQIKDNRYFEVIFLRSPRICQFKKKKRSNFHIKKISNVESRMESFSSTKNPRIQEREREFIEFIIKICEKVNASIKQIFYSDTSWHYFRINSGRKKKKKKKKVNFRSSVRAFPFSFLINAREPRVFRNPG